MEVHYLTRNGTIKPIIFNSDIWDKIGWKQADQVDGLIRAGMTGNLLEGKDVRGGRLTHHPRTGGFRRANPSKFH